LEELELPSVGACFKKWGLAHPTPPPPREAQALATCKGLKNKIK
jgi:hypothetical protein